MNRVGAALGLLMVGSCSLLFSCQSADLEGPSADASTSDTGADGAADAADAGRDALADAEQPPPSVAITGVTATASRSTDDSSPGDAVDGDPQSAWNAGARPAQWIELDLQRLYSVNKLELTVGQWPAGRTRHEVELSSDGVTYLPAITLDQITRSTQVITVPFLEPWASVRFVRITTTLSPSWVAWREITVFSGTVSANEHLRYFGYMSQEGLHDAALPDDYVEELRAMDNTNIAWAYRANLDQLRSLQIKGLMTEPRWLFFDSKGGLRSDWQEVWQRYREGLRGYEDDIYGFYFDEPVWRGYTMDAFLTATATIHEEFPDKAILIVEPWPPIVNGTIPEGYYEYVTDIGHDYYFTRDFDTNDEGWGQFLDQLESFKPHMEGKRFWVVPDGFNAVSDETARWPDAFERYLSLVLTTDAGAGILPFIYNHDETPYDLRAVLDPGGSYFNAAFRERNVDVGRLIIAPR